MSNYSDYVLEKGWKEGWKEGMKEGERRLASLLLKMIAAGELDQISMVLKDKQIRREFYQKYSL